MNALMDAAKVAATDAANGAVEDLKAGTPDPAKMLADVAKGSIPSLGSGAAPVKSEAAKTKASNDYMCDGFQEMFKTNQKLYGEKVFDSLGKYFYEEDVKAKLTAMLEQNIGQYIRSSQFRGTTAAVIKEAIGSVMRESMKKELKNPANFTGICGEITKLSLQRRNTSYGGATRTKRKLRKKTVKRRN